MDTMAFIIALTEMGVITEGIADAVAEYLEAHPEVLENAMAIIGAPEASSTAASAHVPGTDSEYFIYDGKLRKATGTIAQGGSIVTSGSGQNCEEVTVGGELGKTNGEVSDLKSAIDDIEDGKLVKESDITDEFVLEGWITDSGSFYSYPGIANLRATDFIDVTGYEEIEYSLYSRISTSMIALYDSTKTVVTLYKYTDDEARTGTIEIPSNVKYLRATQYMDATHSGETDYIKLTKTIDVGQEFDDIKEEMASKADTDDVPASGDLTGSDIVIKNRTGETLFDIDMSGLSPEVSEVKYIVDATSFPLPGWIDSVGGYHEYQSDTFNATEFISVDGFDTILYSLYSRVTTCMIALYDKNQSIVTKYTYEDDEARTGSITIPENVKYLRATQYVVQGHTDYIKLQNTYELPDICEKTSNLYEKANANRTEEYFRTLLRNNGKIYLLGDSITQGAETTGFIMYDDPVTHKSVRGNSPDYSPKPAGYVDGDFIYEDATRIWYEATSGDGFAQKLKAYLESKFNCTIKNYGMAGATGTQIIAALPDFIDDIDLAFVMFGANDSGAYNLATYGEKLETVITMLLSEGKKVVLMSTPPTTAEFETGKYFFAEDVAHTMAFMADQYNIPFIDLHSEFIRYFFYANKGTADVLVDTVHPNNAGHTLIFNRITEYVKITAKNPETTN